MSVHSFIHSVIHLSKVLEHLPPTRSWPWPCRYRNKDYPFRPQSYLGSFGKDNKFISRGLSECGGESTDRGYRKVIWTRRRKCAHVPLKYNSVMNFCGKYDSYGKTSAPPLDHKLLYRVRQKSSLR